MSRIEQTLAALRAAGRPGLAAYFTAGDPSYDACLALLRGLPAAGADVIELGMPFSDPIADGPVLQLANARALKAGQTLRRTLDLVAALREEDEKTPVVLMGHSFGGYLSLRYALAHPDLVAGLVLVSTGPGYRSDDKRAEWNRYLERAAAKMDIAPGVEEVARQYDSTVIDGLPSSSVMVAVPLASVMLTVARGWLSVWR